jgi:hypothetical protein
MKAWNISSTFLLGYDVALVREGFYFQRSEKGTVCPKLFSDQQTLGCVGQMFLLKVRNPPPRDAASLLKRTDFPPTPLWKSQNPHLPFVTGITVTTGTTHHYTLWNLLRPHKWVEELNFLYKMRHRHFSAATNEKLQVTLFHKFLRPRTKRSSTLLGAGEEHKTRSL